MIKYIAITIGPISNTMNFVSTPAALWASSYMFSSVCRCICDTLIEDYNVSSDRFLVPYPYWRDEKSGIRSHTGVGLLHDRIIFEAFDENGNEFDVTEIKDVRKEVIIKIDKMFNINALDYLMDYIMISGATFEADNPLLDSGKILDSLELSAPFVRNESTNPILRTYTGIKKDESKKDSEDEEYTRKNEEIKRIAVDNLHLDKEEWQLLKNRDTIRSLSDIADYSEKNNMKFSKYYAVVRADGDNVSKIIATLTTKEEYRDFSKKCLSYCQNVADEVKKFGGVTVYSGGDDLLALIPCENKNGNTFFDLIASINTIFAEEKTGFGEYIKAIKNSNEKKKEDEKIPMPSLSFGIFISYYKFPLYEALQASANLLFGKAKDKTNKNCVALTLQKHSGQSAMVVIPNNFLKDISDMLGRVLNSQNKTLNKNEDNERFLLSVEQKIKLFKTLFDEAKTPEEIKNVFDNTFDAADQKKFHESIGAIETYMNTFINNNTPKKTYTENENGEKIVSKADTVCSVLRILKFFTEKKGEEE